MNSIFLENVLAFAQNESKKFALKNGVESLRPPIYSSEEYINALVNDKYFAALAIIRDLIKLASTAYWTSIGAVNIDLYMLSPSISSPTGTGSNSEAIKIQFGNLKTYLTDSAQFGFEPLMFHFDKVYCYLPSMRGENPDERHLNQFFHCEAEIIGKLEDLFPLVEEYIRFLSKTLLAAEPIIKLMSLDYKKSNTALNNIISGKKFKRKNFSEIHSFLLKNNSYFESDEVGRNITNEGEIALAQEMGDDLPLWLCNYDRDITPFYQKPNPSDLNSVINADMLFPPIINGGLGGEIAGAGQRQDNISEMKESLLRQKIDSKPYDWYLKLRDHPNYKTTSGFGLGIERYLSWALGYADIKQVIHYPRLKNIITFP